MLSEKVSKLLNEQICKELYSAYLYLHIANYYNDEGLDGFQNWFEIQAKEERDHALLFRTYMQNNDASVTLLPIDAPDHQFASMADPLKVTLEHERTVTASINTIYKAADEENDYRTKQFLDWFVQEQGEEEKNATDLVKRFELFGSDAHSLYQLNQELSTRVYSAPSLVLD